jgi:hypothetical protein
MNGRQEEKKKGEIPAGVRALARAVNLERVNIVRAAYTLLKSPTPAEGLDDINLSLEAGSQRRPEAPDALLVGVNFELRVTSRATQTVMLRISAGWALAYRCSDAERLKSLSDDELADFAGYNGTYNAWPYLREFCNDATGRMGVAPLTLPTLSPAMVGALKRAKARPAK